MTLTLFLLSWQLLAIYDPDGVSREFIRMFFSVNLSLPLPLSVFICVRWCFNFVLYVTFLHRS